MNEFYFNTGVKQYGHNPPVPLFGNQIWKGGVKQIPFEADAPENASLMFLCNYPDLSESKLENVIVREVFNTSLLSKYAYFRIKL